MNILYCILFSVFLILITIYMTLKWVKRKQLQMIENLNFREEFDLLVDKHLDALVIIFKNQIPMASMFLTDSLTQKLKTKTKEEMLNMVPELKQKILEKLEK